jgi:hypothetical protein
MTTMTGQRAGNAIAVDLAIVGTSRRYLLERGLSPEQHLTLRPPQHAIGEIGSQAELRQRPQLATQLFELFEPGTGSGVLRQQALRLDALVRRQLVVEIGAETFSIRGAEHGEGLLFQLLLV